LTAANATIVTTPALTVTHARKAYGATLAVADVSFDVALGEVVALLGPSGCGKSTLLRLIAGLDPLDGGEIAWDGVSLADVAVHRRGFGLMFQDYALFPHLSVLDNVTFGPRLAGVADPAAEARGQELLALVGLPGFAARDVTTLSGGEQQRVALARALAPEPKLLMLDEPLGALDRALGEDLLVDLRQLVRRLGQTVIYVTHNQEEAFTIADRVVLLRGGRVVQIGTPEALYRQPVDPFAARFLGLGNLLAGTTRQEGEGWVADTAVGPVPLPGPATGPVTVLLRPDAATLTPEPGQWVLAGTLVERSFRGPVARLVLDVAGTSLVFDLPSGGVLPAVGEGLRVGLDVATGVQVFPDGAAAIDSAAASA
jgi:thiamine transport system ATP-binding protein